MRWIHQDLSSVTDPVFCTQDCVKFECAQDLVKANYLDLPRAASLSVLYVGSASSRDEGWLYARWNKRMPAGWGYREIEGWIAARDVTREKVTVLTFGLEGTDAELTEKVETGLHWQDADLQDALRRLGHLHVDLFINCCMFDNPQYATHHPGVHPDVIAGITGHRDFPQFIRDVRNAWLEQLQKRRREEDASSHGLQEFTVAAYCRHGKHRSVAISEILQCILTQEGFLADTMFLSARNWSKRKCRGTCDECQGFSKTKVDALRDAVNWWGSSFQCDISLEMFIAEYVCRA